MIVLAIIVIVLLLIGDNQNYTSVAIFLCVVIGFILYMLNGVYQKIILESEKLVVKNLIGSTKAAIYYTEISGLRSKTQHEVSYKAGIEGTIKTTNIVMKDGRLFPIENSSIHDIDEFITALQAKIDENEEQD
jgi:uncharacterized membrane protein